MTVGSRGRTDPDGSRRRALPVLALSTALGSAGLAETLGKGTAPGIPQAMLQTGGSDVVLPLAALTGLMASGIGVVWRWAR